MSCRDVNRSSGCGHQRVPNNVSPFSIVACIPQENNETGSFTNDAFEATCDV